jgi:hypothetical protein
MDAQKALDFIQNNIAAFLVGWLLGKGMLGDLFTAISNI